MQGATKEHDVMLKAIVESLDEVDEKYHDLYTERTGQYELTGVEGMRTQADIDRLQSALSKERNDHKQTKEKYAPIADRDIDEIVTTLDRIPELEAAAEGKVDNEKMEQLVDARLRTKLAPVERERDQLRQQNQELTGTVEQFQTKERVRNIHDTVRQAASEAKVIPHALDDALMLAERVFDLDEEGRVITRDSVGCTPGVDPKVWFTEMQEKRPHWWGPSQGGGAGGNRGGAGGGANPWSAENWNMTEQSRVYRENPTRAEQLAKSAGTTIGGKKPEAKQ